MNWKRVGAGTAFGALMGVICILGVSQRLPDPVYPSATVYLVGAWYNRVVMGVLIGFAGELKVVEAPDAPLNALLRGVVLGAIVSASFAFFGQVVTVTYFLAGLMFGGANDLLTTYLTREKAQ